MKNILGEELYELMPAFLAAVVVIAGIIFAVAESF